MFAEIAKTFSWLANAWIAHHEWVFVVILIWVFSYLINN